MEISLHLKSYGVLWIRESTNGKYFIGKIKKHWYDARGYIIPKQQEHFICSFLIFTCTK